MTEEIYTPYPNALLGLDKLPRSSQDTLIRLLRVCWKSDHYDWSKPLTMRQLSDTIDVKRRTLDRHLKDLVKHEIIVLESIVHSVFRLTLNPNYSSVGQKRAMLVKNAPSFVITSINNKDLINDESLKEESVGQNCPTDLEIGQNCPTGVELAEMINFLSGKGVSKPALTEIPSIEGMTLDCLQKWWTYAEFKGWRAKDNGRVINKIYSGNPVPPFCLLCGGVDGNHCFVRTEFEGQRECPNGRRVHTQAELLEEYGEIEMI